MSESSPKGDGSDEIKKELSEYVDSKLGKDKANQLREGAPILRELVYGLLRLIRAGKIIAFLKLLLTRRRS